MADFLSLLGVFIAISSPVWIIVLIVAWTRHRAHVARIQANAAARVDDAEVTELKREVNQLRERVSVLEAIVTDSGYQLQEQFRRL